MKQAIEKYDHHKIEAKWQRFWQNHESFMAVDGSKKKKKYILDMFPYPSGKGLHVGHPRGYVGSDVLAHYYRLQGFNVLHPVGFDAFGLPAENAAIKAGLHPADSTKQNIKRFSQQLRLLGLSYDWSRVINTSTPEYYKWTQWLFSLLHKNGLAYQKEAVVNWCPKDKTVLANEQVVNNCCERCGTQVVQKKRKQWFFKITEFAEDLLNDLDELDWPESTKELQRNWIGKSEGAEIKFKIVEHDSSIVVFTTRPDTLFGATYLVLSPEHHKVTEITVDKYKKKVEAYVKQTIRKTELERLTQAKTKTGVFTGAYAINPANGEKIPIWIADYVLGSYGHGAIMAVPAHDERDFEFATTHKLPILEVISCPESQLPYTGNGVLVNSGKFGGFKSEKVGKAIVKEVKGQMAVQYRLRDWLISRQRYWGTPIPVMYDKEETPTLVDEKDLPVLLPNDVEFKPTGESPLVKSKTFNQIPQKYTKRGMVRREFDTMDTFVCSAWYFMRYADPANHKDFASKKKLKYWLPVDIYIGGVEHVAGHVLYARFVTKVLYKLNLIDFDEPFIKLRHQGLIMGDDGEKMSKSRGNVVNPDDIIDGYGTDAFRMYEMFMGPFNQFIPWSMSGIEGVRKFLNRVWSLTPQDKAPKTDKALHKLIKKVTEDIEGVHFNTAVSSFMEFTNLAIKHGITQKTLKQLVILLSPFAPHLAEEMHYRLGSKQSVFKAQWPSFNPKLIEDKMVTIVVQVNGKVRGTLELATNSPETTVVKSAQKLDTVKKHLVDKKNIKHHYVVNRIINFVAK